MDRRRGLRMRFAVVVLATAGLLAGGASAVGASHSWGGYHWARAANPFTLKVGDNVTAAWDSYLDTTVIDWSASTVLDLTEVAGTSNPKRCQGSSGTVQVCNSSYGSNGWLGVAQIWISGGHITQGTVKLNDTYFNTVKYNTAAWRNLVSCQEVGHTLGLAHQDEIFNNANLDTCMDYTNAPESNQHPNTHDYEQLASIYNNHLDTISTVSKTNASSPAPASWGRLVAGSTRSGQTATYVTAIGSELVVTHVIWA